MATTLNFGSSSSTLSDTVTVTNGILQLCSASTVGTAAAQGTVNVAGGTVDIGATGGTAISMATSSFGGAAATGMLNLTGGKTTLSGNIIKVGGVGNSTATVTLNGNSAVLDMGGMSIGSAAQNVVLNAQVGTLQNLLELNGGGVLTKSAAGTLTLQGVNSYTGGTAIAAGVLSVNSAQPVGTSGAISFGGGTLQYTANSAATGDYSARFSTAASQPVSIDTNGQTVTYASPLTSSGGTLTLNDSLGTGTLILTAAETYSGDTTLTAGTLQLGDGVSGAHDGSLAGKIHDNGTVIFADVNNATDAGTIDGAGALVKSGAGNLTLSGVATYLGATTVNSGVLTFSNAASVASGACTVKPTGQLRGIGTLGAIATASGTGAAPTVWPGLAVNVFGLSNPETMNAASVSFTNGGKLDIVMVHPLGNGTQGITQSLNVSGAIVVDSNSALSLAFDSGTFNDFNVVLSTALPSNSPNLPTAAFNVLPAGAYRSGFDVVYMLGGVGGTVVATSPAAGAIGGGAGSPYDTVVVKFKNVSVTPTTIDAFSAEPQGAGVRIAWHTVSEFQNAGFNLYSRPVGASEWTRVNAALIPGRITNPDAKSYAFYDWASTGIREYRLESVSVLGLREDGPWLAGPVTIDPAGAIAAVNADGVEAIAIGLAAESSRSQAASAGAAFAQAADPFNAQPLNESSSIALVREAQGGLVLPATVRDLSASSTAVGTVAVAAARSANEALVPKTAPFNAPPAVAARWFSASGMMSNTFTAAKVKYVAPGVLAIPQSSLPPSFDIQHASIQREGRAVPILALRNNTLFVYAPGYSDDYTNVDALFVRNTPAATAAGSLTHASGLFTSGLPVQTDTATSVSTSYHDVYFDYSTAYRPFTFAPWFSSQYLTDGTDQSFSINTPLASGAPASLTVTLWSLTSAGGVSTDHALQVLVNGQPAGQAQWSGGQKMMQLSFQLPAGVLSAGANRIDLVTPTLPGVGSQICFLHTLTMAYTKTLDASQPMTLTNADAAWQVFELGNLPSANVWIVDARFPDRAALVPYETQAQNDGTYRARFVADSGAVPRGSFRPGEPAGFGCKMSGKTHQEHAVSGHRPEPIQRGCAAHFDEA